MMLGGVPIIVVSPPRMEPKASGISTRDGGTPPFCAVTRATGMRSARAPTLFMNADATATRAVRASR